MEPKLNKLVFIGAGNVATALAKALQKKYTIVQVYSKSASSAKKLGNVLKCAVTTDLSKLTPQADIYIIAVKDDAIVKVAKQLRLKNKIVVHTSGGTDIKVLREISANCGVIWPLQTFSKDSVLKKNVPFCIEASSGKVYNELAVLIKNMSGKVYKLDSVQRAKLHLAAVFANNFTNYMYTVAYNIVEKESVPFDLLLPLIQETTNKLQGQNPTKNQTGPAVRRDAITIKKHEEFLKKNPQYLAVYKLLTKSIQS